MPFIPPRLSMAFLLVQVRSSRTSLASPPSVLYNQLSLLTFLSLFLCLGVVFRVPWCLMCHETYASCCIPSTLLSIARPWVPMNPHFAEPFHIKRHEYSSLVWLCGPCRVPSTWHSFYQETSNSKHQVPVTPECIFQPIFWVDEVQQRGSQRTIKLKREGWGEMVRYMVCASQTGQVVALPA